VLAAVAPSRGWELVGPGGDVQRSTQIFGYAASFDVVRPGPVTVKFRGSWAHGLEVAVEVLLWLVVVALLVCRRRSLARLSSRLGRRRARRARPAALPADVVPDAVGDDLRETAGNAAPDAGVATGAAPR
jgi:hypothetical protein